MDEQMKAAFEKSKTGTKEEKYQSFEDIMNATTEKVDWAYEVWDELVAGLASKDNHQRSRSAQYLSHLAISDPEKRIVSDFPKLWAVTYDEHFVTARHTLQAIWRVGLAGKEQLNMVMEHLERRFYDGTNEKNYTLTRNDIIQDLRHLYDQLGDENIKATALKLIGTVDDPKYQKKYAKIFRG